MNTNPDYLFDEQLARLARHFEQHGKNIYGSTSHENASPLYAQLCKDIVTDAEVLHLLVGVDQSTTVTNLFFAAVHYLLLGSIQHPVKDFYPDLSPTPRPMSEAYPCFRAFCLEHADEIHHIVTTRRVQTNEVRRCAALLPAFSEVSRRAKGKPLALIEIGTSAGLHLLWDHYFYDYGQVGQVGDAHSPVHILCSLRGEKPPSKFGILPNIVSRVGIDLNPIDVREEAATRWLRALIWPEHSDRRQLLDAAVTVAQQHPMQLLAGDASTVLPDLLPLVPSEAVLCLYHSYTLNQMPDETRQRILNVIQTYAATTNRTFYRIAQEGYSLHSHPHVDLYTYQDGEMHEELLAYCESHGRWVEWLG
jgi:hypothetical protein